MNERHTLGKRAEDAVSRHLEHLGFRICARNYRCSTGELDIIAECDDLVVFVEVRSQSSDFYSDPAITVTQPKQRRIASAAQHWLLKNPRPNSFLRFDIAGVRVVHGELCIEVYSDAFSVPWE